MNVVPIRPKMIIKPLMSEGELVEHLQVQRDHLDWQRRNVIAASKKKLAEIEALRVDVEDLEKRSKQIYDDLIINEEELAVFGIVIGRKKETA